MDDRGVSCLGHHQHCSKESVRENFFFSTFLDLGNKEFLQNNRPWPFAHLADVLGGTYPVKQNMLMRDGGVGINLEKEEDTFRNGDSNKNGRRLPSAILPIRPKVREIHEEQRFGYRGDTNDSIQWEKHAQGNWNLEIKGLDSLDVAKQGFDKLAVQGIAKGVCTLSDVSAAPHLQEEEEMWSKSSSLGVMAGAEQSMRAQLDMSVRPSSINRAASAKVERRRKQIAGHQEQVENVWEYALTSEPVPNLLSKRSLVGPHLPHEICLVGPNGPSNLTIRKLTVPSEKQTASMSKTLKINGFHKANIIQVQKCKDAEAMKKRQVQRARFVKQLLCGGFAGVISRTVVAPLDLIKTHLITSHVLRGGKRSALSICKEIVEQGGWQGLFRGNLVNCLRVAPSKAIELCVFETVRRALNKEGHPLKNAAATIAGGAAGMAGTFATYPLELIRTRLSVQPDLYSGVLQTIRKIANDEGFSAFYSGLSPSLVGVFPYAATNYFVYDSLRTTYYRSTGKQSVPTIPTLIFGAVAAAASSAVTYPLEVARRQMQLSLTDALVKKSTVGVILDIYQQEGFLALYRGLGTTWLKLMPAAGISFVCYETARLALCIDDASIVKPEETSFIAEQEPES